jgi:ABC-2 type transport system ATP-binding protein
MTAATEPTIELRGLTKRFGPVTAVDGLSFTVRPGRVTGFLGPNGAGKTTTLRMLLGLVRPTAGDALVLGRRYADLTRPSGVVGAALEATGFHPGRRGRDHLRVLAPAAGADGRRVDEVLEVVGMTDAGHRRVGGYSLGMKQRLALAGALLGDPQVLLLDEPANGLDPAGIVWLRSFLRGFADLGRTVLVSSHLLTEVQQTADDVVVLARGQLRHAGTLESLAGLTGDVVPVVRVRTDHADALLAALAGAGLSGQLDPVGGEPEVTVPQATAAQVGSVAWAAGVEVDAIVTDRGSLEDAFLRLVGDTEPGAG